jgi:hypothetical protein
MRKPCPVSAWRIARLCPTPGSCFIPGALALLAALALCAPIPAQTPAQAAAQTPTQSLTIRLVEAKTGKPIRNKTVSVAFYTEDSSMTNGRRRVALPDGSFWTNLEVDKDGLGSIQVPAGATLVEVGKGLDNDGSKVTENAIHLDMCQGSPGFTKPDSGFQYGRVEDVLRTGFVAYDPECQPRLKTPAGPGQFVVMAWPPSRLALPGMSW